MRAIRAKDTSPELAVRSGLHRAGLRFRLHDSSLPGSPDIVLPRHRTVIFVHGCFWHRHFGCAQSTLPQRNREWWIAKLRRNRMRDRQAQRALEAIGWRVIVVWECAISREHTGVPLDLSRLARLARRAASDFAPRIPRPPRNR